MTNNVDYAITYFKYPILCPIDGESTNKSLKRLKIELSANSSSVDIYLGGGDHGYLGLFLTGVEYVRINLTLNPFVAPNFPGVLTIDALATAVEALHAKELHRETHTSTESARTLRRHYCAI